jgi:transposase
MKKNITIGMDLGDKNHSICVLQGADKIMECEVTNTAKAVEKFFKKHQWATVIIETGTHSPWISRLLEKLDMKVLVGNTRKLRAIWDSSNKSDVRDAEMLARIGRMDPHLLGPIQHRGEQAQMDLELIRGREVIVSARTKMVNHVRGAVKAMGQRIPKCSTDCFHRRAREALRGSQILAAEEPILNMIELMTEKIHEMDKRINVMACESYPATERLQQVNGVGPLTSLAYVLTLEDGKRFHKSRDVGAFLGMTPRRDQSGGTDKQLRISKAGNGELRRLLVGCTHYILGPFGPDCDLRRFGQKLMLRGGKNAKRRAIVAVARKLAVLLHRLWISGAIYDPLWNTKMHTQTVA